MLAGTLDPIRKMTMLADIDLSKNTIGGTESIVCYDRDNLLSWWLPAIAVNCNEYLRIK